MAPERLPKNLLLGTLSAPKCVKFGIQGHLKNESKIKRQKVTKNSNNVSNMGGASRAKMGFFGTTFKTLPQTGARAPRASKIIDCSSKSVHKVTRKLTYLSSLCSLRNLCGELGDPKMAPSFALCVLSFSLRTHGGSHARALANLFRGAPMSRR